MLLKNLATDCKDLTSLEPGCLMLQDNDSQPVPHHASLYKLMKVVNFSPEKHLEHRHSKISLQFEGLMSLGSWYSDLGLGAPVLRVAGSCVAGTEGRYCISQW